MPSKSRVVFGPELAEAVRRRTKIKWIVVGEDAVLVTQEKALALINSQLCQGHLNRSGKLKAIRQIPTLDRFSAAEAWQDCYRTTEAPVMPPSPGWCERVRSPMARVSG